MTKVVSSLKSSDGWPASLVIDNNNMVFLVRTQNPYDVTNNAEKALTINDGIDLVGLSELIDIHGHKKRPNYDRLLPNLKKNHQLFGLKFLYEGAMTYAQVRSRVTGKCLMATTDDPAKENLLAAAGDCDVVFPTQLFTLVGPCDYRKCQPYNICWGCVQPPILRPYQAINGVCRNRRRGDTCQVSCDLTSDPVSEKASLQVTCVGTANSEANGWWPAPPDDDDAARSTPGGSASSGTVAASANNMNQNDGGSSSSSSGQGASYARPIVLYLFSAGIA